MGRVDLVEDRELGRQVALKRVSPGLLPGDELEARSLREARVAAGLVHPGVVRVFSVEQDRDGSLLVVSEYIPGRNLEEAASTWTPDQRARRAARLARPLGEALDAVHAHGLVHRDVKPANVMLREDGAPVLCDFGLARPLSPEETHDHLTRTGTLLGTLDFMDPGLLLGETPGPTSDLYALAATLLQASTGTLPRSRDQLLAILRERSVPPLELPDFADPVARRLAGALAPALGSRHLERYPRGAALAAAVELALAEPAPGSRGAQAAPRPGATPRHRWGAAALLGLGLLVWWSSRSALAPVPAAPTPSDPAPSPTGGRVARAETELREAARRLAAHRPAAAPPFGPLPFDGGPTWSAYLRGLRAHRREPGAWSDAEAFLDAAATWHLALRDLAEEGEAEAARVRWRAAAEGLLLGPAWTVVLELRHLDLASADGLGEVFDRELLSFARQVRGRWESLRLRLERVAAGALEVAPNDLEALAYHALVAGLAGDPAATRSRAEALASLAARTPWTPAEDRISTRVLAGLGNVQVTPGIPCDQRRETLEAAWALLEAKACLAPDSRACPGARRQWHRAAFGLVVDCPVEGGADRARMERLEGLLRLDPDLRARLAADLARYVTNVARSVTPVPPWLEEHLRRVSVTP